MASFPIPTSRANTLCEQGIQWALGSALAWALATWPAWEELSGWWVCRLARESSGQPVSLYQVFIVSNRAPGAGGRPCGLR